MANSKKSDKSASSKSFRFNAVELILLTLCLIGGTALITAKLSKRQTSSQSLSRHEKSTSLREGAWGELLVQTITLERPSDLIRAEETSPQGTTWIFSGMNVPQVRSIFSANGLTADQIEKALASDRVNSQGDNTVIIPSEDFLFSLNPETRQKLYAALHGKSVNNFLDFPCVFPKDNIQAVYSDARLHSDDVALLKKLVYPGDGSMKLADYEMLISKIPTSERRIVMAQILSQLSVSIPSLRIRPNSDIEKILRYWGNMENVRSNNIRPMLESLKRLPDGGTISLSLLLPPFARHRVFTYPEPNEEGDPQMDCHWSTFNFSNLELDHRFNDEKFVANYLKESFDQITRPSAYGDIVLLVNEKSEIHHSAVYLADDLVFTKYGNNEAQPWIIVSASDMQAEYSFLKPIYMRKK